MLDTWPLDNGVTALSTLQEHFINDAYVVPVHPFLCKLWWVLSYRMGVAASNNGCSDWSVLQPDERIQDIIHDAKSYYYCSTSQLFSITRDTCTQVCDGQRKSWLVHVKAWFMNKNKPKKMQEYLRFCRWMVMHQDLPQVLHLQKKWCFPILNNNEAKWSFILISLKLLFIIHNYPSLLKFLRVVKKVDGFCKKNPKKTPNNFGFSQTSANWSISTL